MSTNRLFFATLPDLKLLKGFKARHNVTNTPGMQPTCCRELLFTMPDVLVSPAFDNKKDLFIIAQESIASSEDFLNQLNKLQIKLCSRLDVDAEFFQYCLTYSIYQKLAPFWNKTGSFLAQGRSFLQECDKFSAIRLEVIVTDKICLALEPFLVKMQPPMLEEFMVDSKAEYNFKRMKDFTIVSGSIQDLGCYVLPSLKLGKVHSITHEIPLNAPFKSYDEMKQHWKLMYGYRLPSGSCKMYFNVKFFGSTIFTYPEWCIRKNEPIVYFRCDPDAICKQFLQDLFTRIPSTCGSSLRFTKDSFYWQKSLLSAKKGSNPFLIKSVTQSPKLNHVQQTLNSATSKTTNSTNMQRRKGFQYIECAENNQNNLQNVSQKKSCFHSERNLQHERHQNLFSNHSMDNCKSKTLIFNSELKVSKNVIDIPDSPFVVTSPCSKHKLADSIDCNEKLGSFDKSFENNFFTNQDPDVCIVPDIEEEALDFETEISNDELVKSTYNESITCFTKKKEILSHNSSNVVKKHILQSSQRSNFIYKENSDSVVPLNKNDGSFGLPNKDDASVVPLDKDSVVWFNKDSHSVVNKDDASVVPLNENDCVVSLKIKEFISTDKKVLIPKIRSRIIPSFIQKKKTFSQCEMPIHRVLNTSCVGSSKLKPSFLAKNMRQVVNNVSAQARTKRLYPSQLNNQTEDVKIQAELSPKNTSILKTQPKRQCVDILTLCDSVPKVPKFCSGLQKIQKSVEKTLKAQHSKIKHRQNINENQINTSKQCQTFDSASVSQTLESLPSSLNSCTTIMASAPDTNLKKQRSKSKVQDIDVESMARENKLGKVNLITLKCWLNGKGVSCKSSEKKEILVRKVEVFLNIFQDDISQQVEK